MLLAYLSAVQASTGNTPHFILFKREMRLACDTMYRYSELKPTRYEYPNEVRKTEGTYERACDRLHL